jgi:hypothetical protein
VVIKSRAPIIHKICINKSHQSNTLQIPTNTNKYHLVERLVDIGASMFMLSIILVRELGIMCLGMKSYKTMSMVVIQAFKKISKLIVHIGQVQCNMNFMILNINNYDDLLGLDFFIKIGDSGH